MLSSGWALKENQKYGKKGSGKRMKKHVVEILQSLFLADDGDIDCEDIPKESTIQNWINRYSAAFKKASTEQALQE